MQTIGEKIYNLRKKAGMSQDEFGFRIGVSRQAVSQWETNTLKPRSDKIMAMCEMFNVSAEYFMQDTELATVTENEIKDDSSEKQYLRGSERKRVSRAVIACVSVTSVLILSVLIICMCLFIYPREGDETVASIDIGLTDNGIAAVLIVLAVAIVALNIFLIIKLIRGRKK